jgi:hypothetical protein
MGLITVHGMTVKFDPMAYGCQAMPAKLNMLQHRFGFATETCGTGQAALQFIVLDLQTSDPQALAIVRKGNYSYQHEIPIKTSFRNKCKRAFQVLTRTDSTVKN